jgi:predicted ATPase
MPSRAPRRRTTQTPASPLSAGAGGAPIDGPQLMGVRYTLPKNASANRFPYSVPSIANLDGAPPLDLDTPVTCFVGENGSGKSTLLEAIAIAANLPVAGHVGQAKDDPTLAEQKWLSYALTLTWRSRNNRGFFLRAEDFFGFQNLLKRERAEFLATRDRIEEEYADRSAHARGLALGPINNSLREMEVRYGADPDARSHGEAFLNFFQQRLVPRGLYLLDEPEAALSPQRQLALLAMMFELVADGAQFIIATHSPLLLAFPGARIYAFGDVIEDTPWDETEHVRLTREFLNGPERYLRGLREG